MQVLVTGATGFIAAAVIPALQAAGHQPVAAVRRKTSLKLPLRYVGDIGPETDWSEALAEIDAVVHLAGLAHRVDGESEHAFDRINGAGTARLSESAASAGVRRFVFVSSIKVHGEYTPADGPPFCDTDTPAPSDAYARSKLAGEKALLGSAEGSGMTATIIRPPLVYGPGVPANFRSLMHVCDRGLPLPLASVRNRRSLIASANLASAITACLEKPAAAGRIFPLCDGEDFSTPGLIRAICNALGRPSRLFPFPVSLLRLAGTLTGRGPAVQRLTESLAVDASAIRGTLGWRPPFSVSAALAETAAEWRTEG